MAGNGAVGIGVWIALKEQRSGRFTHWVNMADGAIACGMGHADLRGFDEVAMERMEAEDAWRKRCPRCFRVLVAAGLKGG